MSDQTDESTTTDKVKDDVSQRSAFWKLLKVVAFIAIASAVLFSIQRATDNQTVDEVQTFRIAPEFEFTSFDGETVRLSDLRGQGVVLNFWASWCGPCRAEAPLLAEAWAREQDAGVVFVGMTHQDKDANAIAFLEANGLLYPNGPDDGLQWSRKYGVRGIPSTFFIDADGMVVSHYPGMIFSADDLARRIDDIRPH